MQSLKKIVTNGLIVLGLSLGLIVSAAAAATSEEVKKQAEQGNVMAQLKIAANYQLGANGMSQDYAKSHYWFKKAADQGSPEGQYLLGYIYDNGKGVPKDYSKAVYWFKKAADKNYAPAQFNLGIMYDNGEGIRQNKTTAKELYGKACDAGLEDGCYLYRKLNEQGY